jgi:hypothetical protein
MAQQTASVNGYITDAQTGETLIAANVALKGTTKGTSSNNSGYFSLPDIAPGTYTLLATYVGYQQIEREITLAPNESLRLDLELQPQGYKLDELVVQSEANQEEERAIGTAKVETEFIKKVPSVFQADVFRSLQLLPGIKSASDFSSGLYIRGGSPDQTLILLDRTTVYNPSHFFGFFSTFNPDAVKDIQLYKGGYPAKYGGRLGSVLSIFNKDGNRDEFEGSVTLGMLASRVSAEGPFKNGSWMFSFRRSTLEPLLSALRQSLDNIPESFYFWDMNGKINYDANENNKLSLAFYAGNDDLKFPFGDDARINLDYGNQTLSSTWTHIFSDNVFSNFTATASRYFNFPSFDVASTPFERSNNIYDFSIQGDVEYFPSDNHDISTGFDLSLLTLKIKDRFDGDLTYNSRIHSQYGSFYIQDKWKISDRWTVTPGLRLNGFSEGNYLRWAPRLSAEYRPSDRICLQGAYGRYHQFLTLFSNEAFTGFDAWYTTDEGVPPSSGSQYILGLKTIPWEGYSLDIEGYYRTMENLFEPDPFLPDQAGVPYEETFRFGEGYATGVELLFKRNIGRLTGFAGYTFGITRRNFPGFNKPIEGTKSRTYPPKYDRIHDIKVVLNYDFNARWSTSAVFNYATGQAYTKPLGRTAAFNFPTSSLSQQQLVVGKVNASRLPSYHRMDVSFSRKGTFFGLGEAQWKLQLVNLYSRRNIWFYNYDLDENPAQREAVKLLPVLPTISYTLNF